MTMEDGEKSNIYSLGDNTDKLIENLWPSVYEDGEGYIFDNNGFGSYSRGDVDIFVAAKTSAEAEWVVAETVAMVKTAAEIHVVGRPLVLSTRNTVTVAAGYPCRHVQIITKYARSVSSSVFLRNIFSFFWTGAGYSLNLCIRTSTVCV